MTGALQSTAGVDGATRPGDNVPHLVPGLIASYSNVSTSTVDTEVTSPMAVDDQLIMLVGGMESASPTSLALQEGSNSSSDERASNLEAYTLGKEGKQGAKRTASGAVKAVDDKRLQSAGREQRALEVRCPYTKPQSATKLKTFSQVC
jgi:hypothetical protein